MRCRVLECTVATIYELGVLICSRVVAECNLEGHLPGHIGMHHTYRIAFLFKLMCPVQDFLIQQDSDRG